MADIFDRDGDGFIDYKEFVAALRPDREVRYCVMGEVGGDDITKKYVCFILSTCGRKIYMYVGLMYFFTF